MSPNRTFVNREGYWKDGKNSLLPMPKARKKAWKGKKRFLEALSNAVLLARATRYKGWSNCRVCNKKNGISTYSLGDWEWPSGFYHYVEEHNVRPSLAFQEFILGEVVR